MEMDLIEAKNLQIKSMQMNSVKSTIAKFDRNVSHQPKRISEIESR